MKTLVYFVPLLALAAFLTGGAAALQAASPATSAGAAASVRQTTQAAPGAESHEKLFDWINFTILIVVLVYVLRKPAAAFFHDRSAAVRQGLEEGRKALESARTRLEAVEEKMRGLEAEIAALQAQAAKEMVAERERLKIAARKDSERILQSAASTIQHAVDATKAELTAHAMRQAADMAEKVIRERLDENGRARLVKQFLDGVRVVNDGSSQPPA
ncbi:MAG: hypothetical protein ACRD10_03055 [Terriglobia bacterium]